MSGFLARSSSAGCWRGSPESIIRRSRGPTLWTEILVLYVTVLLPFPLFVVVGEPPSEMVHGWSDLPVADGGHAVGTDIRTATPAGSRFSNSTRPSEASSTQ